MTNSSGTRGGRGVRARVQRAMDTGDNENELSVLQIARNAMPEIMQDIVTKAKNGDARSRELLFDVAKDELKRARSAGALEMLGVMTDIREAGSPVLVKVWRQVIGPHASTLFKPLR